MATHLTREQLKRNELGEAVEKGVHFAEHHIKAILALAAGVLGLAIVAWAIIAWRGGVNERANVALGEALEIAAAPVIESGATPNDAKNRSFASAAERDARAKSLFEGVVSEFGGTDSGATARLWLADKALATGDQETARALWRDFLAQSPQGILAAAAQHNLWTIDRADGKGEAVLAEVRRALENARSALPADALLWELAVTQGALDHGAEEQAALRRIVDEHPSSPYASSARQRLAAGEVNP